MYVHKVIACLLMVFLIGIAAASEPGWGGTGWIAGTVINSNDGVRLSNATVMVVYTSYGNMTDEEGDYIIRLSEGIYELNARMIGFPSVSTDSVIVTSGDTTWVDFELGNPVHRYVWNDAQPHDTAEILLKVVGVDDSPSIDVAVYASRSGYGGYYCSVRAVTDNVYAVEVPVNSEKLTVSLPFTGQARLGIGFDTGFPDELTIDFTGYDLIDGTPDFEDLFAIARSTDTEWTSEDVSLSRTVLDYARWGDNRVQQYGLKHVAYYPDSPYADGSWRILLVFRDKIVVLADGVPEIIHPIEFESFRVVHFSPGGRCLLIYDGIGLDESAGDAVIIDTVTGSQVVFDPSPEMTRIQGEPIGCYISSPSRITAVADDGSVCILSDGLIRIFDEYGRYNSFSTLEYYDRGFTTSYLFITSDGDEILAFSPSDSSTIACILNDDLRPIASGIIPDFVVGSMMSRTDIDTSGDLGVIICSNPSETGTLVFDVNSGSDLYYDEDGRYFSALSNDGSIAAYTYLEEPANIFWDDNSGYSLNVHHRIINTDTGDVLYEYPEEIRDWTVSDFVDIASNGAGLLMLHYNTAGSRFRLALLAADGLPVWLGPARTHLVVGRRGNPSLAAISEDGTRLICSDDRFIQVLEFTEHDLDTAD